MSLMPKISVIVPILENNTYLDKCINSLLFQTYKNIEIICVCESSDNTANIDFQKYSTFENFKLVSAEGNFGQLVNHTLSIAEGDYISIINQNDWVLLTLYNSFIDVLNEVNKDIDVYIFKSASFKKGKNDTQRNVNFDITSWENHNSTTTVHRLKDCMRPFSDRLMISNKIYRKKFLEENSINFSYNLSFEEQFFTAKALIKAESILVNDKIFYRHRANYNEIEYSEEIFDIFKVIYLIKNEFIKHSIFESFKYAIFQHEFMMYGILYKLCKEQLKNEFFKYAAKKIIESEMQSLDLNISSKLRNYPLVEIFKSGNRTHLDQLPIDMH